MKKIVAMLTVFSMLFAFAACKKEEKPEVTQTTRNMNQQEIVVHETVTDNSGEIVTEAGGEAVTVTEIHTEIITEPESLAAKVESIVTTIEKVIVSPTAASGILNSSVVK